MKITRAQLKETIRTIMKEESEYQQFFKKALEKSGKSITDMSDEEKKDFFNKIDAAWDGKGEKNEGNAFGAAVTAAKEAGEDSFEVDGKEYKVESVNEEFKHTIYIDTPRQVASKKIAAEIEALAKKGIRSKEIGLKMGFVGNQKAATDAFQKIKNKVYFSLHKDESVNESLVTEATDIYLKGRIQITKFAGADGLMIQINAPKYKTAGDHIVITKNDFIEILKNSSKLLNQLKESVTEARSLNKSYVMYLAVDKKLRELEAAQKAMAQQYFSEKDEKKKAVLLDKMKKGTKVLQATRKNLNDLETNYVLNLDKDAEYQGESVVNEITLGQALKSVANGETSSVEGIKMSRNLANAIASWALSSPYGKKYGTQMLKSPIGSSWKIILSSAWGVEPYLQRWDRAQLAKVKPELEKIKSKVMGESTESVNEGRAFINAAKKAKAEGKTEFEFNGKTYPVTIKD